MSAPSPGRADAGRGGRRRHILDTAATQFHERGFAVATMEDLAAEIGMGKSTLYHYFRSKDEILAEIHDEFVEMLIARAEARQGTRPSATEELHGLVTDMVEFSVRLPGYARTFFEPIRDLPASVQDVFQRRRDHYYAIVDRALADGQAAGEIADLDRGPAARTIVAACSWVQQGTLDQAAAGAVAAHVWRVVQGGVAGVGSVARG